MCLSSTVVGTLCCITENAITTCWNPKHIVSHSFPPRRGSHMTGYSKDIACCSLFPPWKPLAHNSAVFWLINWVFTNSMEGVQSTKMDKPEAQQSYSWEGFPHEHLFIAVCICLHLLAKELFNMRQAEATTVSTALASLDSQKIILSKPRKR